jgi:hypothetical protein
MRVVEGGESVALRMAGDVESAPAALGQLLQFVRMARHDREGLGQRGRIGAQVLALGIRPPHVAELDQPLVGEQIGLGRG